MSFYQTSTPLRFSTQNPDVSTQQNIQFLRSGFQQPDSVDSLTDLNGNGLTYTAAQFLNRYIVRDNLGGSTSNDTTPTALQIITALNNDQWIRATSQDKNPLTVRRGFYFDVTVYNEDSADDVVIGPGSGVTIGAVTTVTINPGKIGILRVLVTNTTSGAEEVYISVLSA